MAGASVEFGANTGPFERGLARVRADWSRTKANFKGAFFGSTSSKGVFSQGGGLSEIASIGRAAAAFGGLYAVGQKVVEVFRLMADIATQVEERTSRAMHATFALVNVRNGLEQRKALGEKDERFLANASKAARAEANRVKGNPLQFTPGFVGDAWKARIQRAEEVAQDLEAQYQTRVQQNAEVTFQLQNQTREINRQADRLEDQAKVREGIISLEQAALNEVKRQNIEIARVNTHKELGANALQGALNTGVEAAFAYQDARIQTIKGFVADSLARIGGGGNVYTGGLSADPVASELKQQTQLLREIRDAAVPKAGVTARFVFKR